MSPYEALTILKDKIIEDYELENEYYIYKIIKFFYVKYCIQDKELNTCQSD